MNYINFINDVLKQIEIKFKQGLKMVVLECDNKIV